MYVAEQPTLPSRVVAERRHPKPKPPSRREVHRRSASSPRRSRKTPKPDDVDERLSCPESPSRGVSGLVVLPFPNYARTADADHASLPLERVTHTFVRRVRRIPKESSGSASPLTFLPAFLPRN